jgi:surface antigen
MRTSFVIFALLLIPMGLVGCHTNSNQENTVMANGHQAVVGVNHSQIAATEAGAHMGTIITGAIGNSMDSTDDAEVAQVLNDNPPNQPNYWKNEKSGNKYTVLAISGRISYIGYSDCRRYHSVAMIDGNKESITAIACRIKNGKWKSV